MRLAWRESQPGLSGEHEEGGFIVEEAAGSLRVNRWPRGSHNTIVVPIHLGCRAEGEEIIASFHTHPNTGLDHLQEPSETDSRAARYDPELKSPRYAGELVISAALVYGIMPSGNVIVIGKTESIRAELR